MASVLHGSARTTPRLRALFQASQEYASSFGMAEMNEMQHQLILMFVFKSFVIGFSHRCFTADDFERACAKPKLVRRTTKPYAPGQWHG